MEDEKRRVVLPANPGWAIVEPFVADDGTVTGIDHDPIIAWAIVSEDYARKIPEGGYMETVHTVYPITIERGDEDIAHIIRRPDGLYVSVGYRGYETEQEVIDDLNREAKEERERKQRKREALLRK